MCGSNYPAYFWGPCLEPAPYIYILCVRICVVFVCVNSLQREARSDLIIGEHFGGSYHCPAFFASFGVQAVTQKFPCRFEHMKLVLYSCLPKCSIRVFLNALFDSLFFFSNRFFVDLNTRPQSINIIVHNSWSRLSTDILLLL